MCVMCNVDDVCAEGVLCVLCVCIMRSVVYGVCTDPEMPLQFGIAPCTTLDITAVSNSTLPILCQPLPTLRPLVDTAPHCSETSPSSPQLSGEMPVIRLM